MNRRGWFVLLSIASDDGHYCVDIFERAEGSFGFEHFRSDPEDQSEWTALGNASSLVFASPVAAGDAAAAAVTWLTKHVRAGAVLSSWRAEQGMCWRPTAEPSQD